jgi:hypothetical protein
MAPNKKKDPASLVSYWFVYNVKMVCGFQPIKISEGCQPGPKSTNAVLGPGIYSTEVNIFNYHDHVDASVYKYYVSLVREAKTIGFEPLQQPAKEFAHIMLRPNSATGDDCCTIAEILKVKNLLNIGFLKIVSSVDLAVTAVYTASDLEKNSVVSIDVEQIIAKTIPNPTNRG